jgi:AraC-like DNA-binding protein
MVLLLKKHERGFRSFLGALCGIYSRFVTSNEIEGLHRRLHRAFHGSSEAFRAFAPGRHLAWGYETRREDLPYAWDGRRRGDTRERGRVLFQYTLAGEGAYEEGGKHWALPPGRAFTVHLPSAHCYYLPKKKGPWTFFWFIVRHPWIAERVRALRRREEAVQDWPAGSRPTQAAAVLFEAACAGRLRDLGSFEEHVLTWLWAAERELYEQRYPAGRRERLLVETRRLILARLDQPPDSMELAEIHGLDRSIFSRKFKAITGLSPMAFATEVRLEEALKLLRTRLKLKAVAAQTGFADANHFCKVFRRHFHTSPGAYRRLVT